MTEPQPTASEHVRAYLPLTADQLRDLHRHRVVTVRLTAYAVTDAVRASDPAGDPEAWEYAALQDAAKSCLAAGRPVIVAAADVDAGQLADTTPDGSRVEVTGTVTLPRVAAFHVGDGVLPQDRGGADPEAEIELSWYDTTELAHLVNLV